MAAIASHNSWSYLKPSQWWIRIFNFIAKCQSKSISYQLSEGVYCFDLRVSWDYKDNKFVCAHGLARYGSCNIIKDLREIAVKSKQRKKAPYVRVLLETARPTQFEIAKFYDFCQALFKAYPTILFFGGFPTRKWGENIYNFPIKAPSLDDKYASVVPPKIRGLWPWLYAHRHNAENIKKGTTKDFLFIDFV